MRSLRNKKAVGPIGAIMLFIMFIIMYFVFLASWIDGVGTRAIADAGYTGFEAFFFANLNLWVVVIMILGMMGWMYFGGQQ